MLIERTTLAFSTKESIFDVFLAKMLPNSDNCDEQTHLNEMSLLNIDLTSFLYMSTVKNFKLFQLSIFFAGRGTSFQMPSTIIWDAKDSLDCVQLVGCNEYVDEKLCETPVLFLPNRFLVLRGSSIFFLRQSIDIHVRVVRLTSMREFYSERMNC